MSQEKKNIQPSSTPTQSPSSQENRPFWKASLIKVLRGTSRVLQTTAIKLETEPFPGTEEKSGFLQKVQQLWISILRKIRLILPAQFSAKLSDPALTGIIGGLAVIALLITSNPFDRKPPQIATVPPDTEIPQVISTTETDIAVEKEIPAIGETQETIIEQEETPPQQEIIIEQPETPVIVEEIPPQQETPIIVEKETPPQQDTEQPEIPPIIVEKETPPQQDTEQPEIPPIIVEKEIPPQQDTEQPEIPLQQEIETPSSPIPLTPEETLIAAIQNQVGDIGDRTFPGIVESIQANFADSNLTLKISKNWYELDKKEQNQLAAEILQRSQELDFTHLEITDLQGKLIARSPVVGTEMIIFKR